MQETTQLGTMDIHILLYLSDSNRYSFLEKRWDLEKSPFFKYWIKGKPSDLKILFPYFPHTGDACRLLYLLPFKCHLEFKSKKTTLTPTTIYIESEQGYNLYYKDGSKVVDETITTKLIVEALLHDGWKERHY